MKKILFFLVIFMVCFFEYTMADNLNPEEEDITVPSITDVIPVDPSLIPLVPGSKPTIPTLDPMHTPLMRNNAFGIDLSNWMGAEGTMITGRTTFKSKDKWHGMEVYGDKGITSIGVNYKFPTTESLGGTFYFDAEYNDYTGGGAPSMYTSAYNVYRLYFERDYYAGDKYETQLTVSHTYYDLRGENGTDGQEIGAGMALTNLWSYSSFKIVPSFYLGYVWDLETMDKTGVHVNNFSGTVAEASIDAYWKPDPSVDSFLFDFYAKINYNDDADVNGEKIKGEFTDITIGAVMDFELINGIIASPTANYVYYMNDKVNYRGDNSDIWVGVTLRYNF